MTQEEFQKMIAALRPRLVAQARHYLADAADAEDAVQDTLMRLWQMHDSLRPPVDALAAVLLRNLCIDLLRRQNSVSLDAAGVLATDSARSETAAADVDGQIERMMAAVEQLPDLQQTLLRLHHMEGMETRRLAEEFQMSDMAVRKVLSRARLTVRRLLVVSLAVAVVAIGWWLGGRDGDECVVYVYGQKTTDPEAVMREMRQAAHGMTDGETQVDVAAQLDELFQ